MSNQEQREPADVSLCNPCMDQLGAEHALVALGKEDIPNQSEVHEAAIRYEAATLRFLHEYDGTEGKISYEDAVRLCYLRYTQALLLCSRVPSELQYRPTLDDIAGRQKDYADKFLQCSLEWQRKLEREQQQREQEQARKSFWGKVWSAVSSQ